MLRKLEQKFNPGGFVKQSVNEPANSINDIDHEALHFLIIKTRHFRPRDSAVRALDGNI
jgi:hypothetical protein